MNERMFLSRLQVYFRIHVSIIKLVLKEFPDVDSSVLEHHLDVASKGPFFHPELDLDTPRGSVSKVDSVVSGENLMFSTLRSCSAHFKRRINGMILLIEECFLFLFCCTVFAVVGGVVQCCCFCLLFHLLGICFYFLFLGGGEASPSFSNLI